MDLSDHETKDAFEALYRCASDKNENEIIQATCGDSLAEIMVRTNLFRSEYASNLSKHADAEFKNYIKHNKPQSLDKI